jgi:iron complex transport system substrate-binding protein
MGLGLLVFAPANSHSKPMVQAASEVGRIVSMAPNLTEILFALGLDEKIVGVTRDSDYPPAAVEKPRVGDFWQVDIEAVIAARPDLVITLGFDRQKNLAHRLGRIGCKCLVVDIEKVDDLFEAIRRIGHASGSLARAEKLIAQIANELVEIEMFVKESEPVKLLWVVQREPLRIAGPDTFVNEMIELAGGKNVIGSTVHKYPPIGPEQIIASGVEVIIEPAMVTGQLEGQQESAIEFYSRYRNVPAVVNNRIYVIDGDTVSRLGPRLCEGVQTIGRCLRPELFED